MKKIITMAFSVCLGVLFADPTVFPYDTELTERLSEESGITVSDSTVARQLDGGAGDNLVIARLTGVRFSTAGLEVRLRGNSDSDLVANLWMGEFDSAFCWRTQLSDGPKTLGGGVVAQADTPYDIEIDIDRSVRKVCFKVGTAGGELVELDDSGVTWLPLNADVDITTAVFSGSGNLGTITVESGVRGGYAEITGVEKTYSFDYSAVTLKINVGDAEIYGDQLKVTLQNGSETVSQQTPITASGTATFEFSELRPGYTYDCIIEVVKGSVAASVTDPTDVVLASRSDWHGFVDGEFDRATGKRYNIIGGVIEAVDNEQPVEVVPDNAATDKGSSVIEITVDNSETYAVASAYEGVQTALALTAEGWKCLINGSWIQLANDSVSTELGVYRTRAEFNFLESSPKVRFSVMNGTRWYVLAKVDDASVTWFTYTSDKTKIEKTGIVGDGKISLLNASYTSGTSIQPEVEGNTIVIAGSTDADLSKIASGTYDISNRYAGDRYAMRWTDNGGKRAKLVNGQLVVENEAPANGIASYDSYVLGLDTADEASVPVLDSAQNAEAGKMDVKLGNVVPKTEVATVSMELQELSAPKSETPDKTYSFDIVDGAQIDLPSGLKYYKVKISIKTK